MNGSEEATFLTKNVKKSYDNLHVLMRHSLSPGPPMTRQTWNLVEPDLQTALRAHDRPLEALAAGNIPAIVLRNAYPLELCERVYRRLIAEELLFDPHGDIPDSFKDKAIPEGYYREGKEGVERRAWQERLRSGKTRIDVGTSLGYRGSDPAGFFAHAAETHQLFAQLFADMPSPVEVIYRRLEELSRDKRVVTAHEPDGRQYGPAIFRAHYGGYTYAPHFDSVRLREKREEFAVHEFEHQFAGVLVLRNSVREGRSAECTLHHYLWQPEVQPHLDNGTFHQFAKEHGIDNVQVHLEPGDLYFFNTRNIHEVPGIDGPEPRVVLATFIGYSSDRNDIFVWS